MKKFEAEMLQEKKDQTEDQKVENY